MKKYFIFIFLCVFVTGAIVKGGPNLLVNGGFENPVVTDPSGWHIYYGTEVDGWNAGTNGIEIQRGVAGDPYEGYQHVELDTNHSSLMYQDIDTVSGQYYTLSFAYSARPNDLANPNEIKVFWDTVLLDTLTAVSGSQTDWTIYTYTVQANTVPSILKFQDSGLSNSYGGYIDDVKLCAVPAPGAFLLGGIGISLVGWIKRRKTL